MRPSLSTAARLVASVAVFATALALSPAALAVTVPETLADRQPVQVGPVEPGFPIDHLGVIWDEDHDHAADHADQPGAHGAVRFRIDGRWGPWVDLMPDGAAAPGEWASGLVPGGDADAYQVRGVPAHAGGPRAVALNTTDGPAVKVSERPGGTAGALTSCRSRAEWGADESLRDWQPDFYPVQTLTVHHTATKNDDGDPAATVRAIYRYHAVDRNFGDIGYQYLIDEAGVVYEGRWSGTTSVPCSEGGDGSDFGHETSDLDGDRAEDEMVTAAHVGGWNSGNMGVSVLGDFTKAEPKAPAVDSLEAVLTELSRRHGIDPAAKLAYVNPVNGSTKTVDAISGHRDWEATECPGDRLYAQLPTIRTNVAAALSTTAPDSDGTVDDVADAVLSVSAVEPGTLPTGRTTATIIGTGFAEGARVSFHNGKGHTPVAGPTTLIDGVLETTVTVEAKGPSSDWDVRVTQDGKSATCSRCAYVKR